MAVLYKLTARHLHPKEECVKYRLPLWSGQVPFEDWLAFVRSRELTAVVKTNGSIDDLSSSTERTREDYKINYQEIPE